MNIGNFTSNFTVTIVHLDNSTSNASVHFKVQCVPNGRVSIHTVIVDTTELTEGFTDADIVTSAWDSVKTTVNAWALTNIAENRLSELTIISTSNVIGVSTFNTHFTVKVSQFEAVPNIDPTHWLIQLQINRKTHESIFSFFTALVPLTQEYCNNTLCSNIAQAAWDMVKNQACDWALSNSPSNTVVNTIYTPTAI
jgi:hypothetical protein